jgi:hypothetical protein
LRAPVSAARVLLLLVALIALPKAPGVTLIALFLWCGIVLPVGTYALGLMLAVPVIAGATCAALTVASILDLPAPPPALLTLALLASLAHSLRGPERPARMRIGDKDLVALAVATITFTVLYRPFFGASPGKKLAFLSHTTDAGTHLQLIRGVMKGGGYLTLHGHLAGQLRESFRTYPPGLSGSVGTFLRAFLGSDPSIPTFLRGASFALIFGYALMVLLGTRIALAVVDRVAPDPGRHVHVIVGTCALGAAVFGPGALLLDDANYATLLALLALLAAICLLMEGTATTSSMPLLLALLTVLGMHSWYLLAPAFAVTWLVLLARARGHWWASLTGIAFAGAFSLFPILTGPGVTQVNAPGYVDPLSRGWGLGYLTATLVSLAVLLAPAPGRRARLLLAGPLVILLLSTGLVGVLQVASAGSLNYYVVKLLLAALVMSGVGLSAASGILVSRCSSTAPLRWLRALVVTAAALGLPLLSLGMSTELRRFVRGDLPRPTSVQTLDAVVADHAHGIGAREDVWLIVDCRPKRPTGKKGDQDFVEAKWVYDLSVSWSPGREAVHSSYLEGVETTVREVKARAASGAVDSVEVYVRRGCVTVMDELANTPVLRVVPT